MQNQEIASILKYATNLSELHDENAFKIKAMLNAITTIETSTLPLTGLSIEKLSSINGIGESIAAKILEISSTGTLKEITDFEAITPSGVIEMLTIKGIGPKKIRTLWLELQVETMDGLLQACDQKKVRFMKGFGEKTEESIRQFIIYSKANKNKLLFAEAEFLAASIEQQITEITGIVLFSVAGEVRRKMEIVERLQFIAGTKNVTSFLNSIQQLPFLEKNEKQSGPFTWRGNEKKSQIEIEIKVYTEEKYATQLYVHSSSLSHLTTEIEKGNTLLKQAYNSRAFNEQVFLKEVGLDFIPAECREGGWEIEAAKTSFPSLLQPEDLKGILHNHTTYSDGLHSLEQMALSCKEMGYEYLGICDHSKSGNFYNGGMYENKVREQQKEIDFLNEKLFPFKIFKGIESDILNDGALDYEEDVLKTFDFIVASVHSNMKMEEHKATARLIKAIENPFTTILGHPSGRILLKREPYPLNYNKIIDACAANSVIIEINADPNRLDLDWRYVHMALDKGVLISVNPDAHSMDAYTNMKYGVFVGRKAGLTKEMTFNSFSIDIVAEYFANRRKKI